MNGRAPIFRPSSAIASRSTTYFWLPQGKLDTRSADFRVACIIPMEGIAADRDLVPDYPGITESESFSDWDPPFPIDLQRVRPQDEDYWKKYRTTPKAFIPLYVGQKLWQSRFGKLTSLRVSPYAGHTFAEMQPVFERSLHEALDPAHGGFAILPVRAQGMDASRGATDFGEYFLYFSFFLVVSALMLTALFFKLGIEQRLREIGVLQAVGFPASKIRTLFLAEGLTARCRRQLARFGGRDRLRRICDRRSQHVVGGRRRHDDAAIACFAAFAGTGRGRWHLCGARLRRLDAEGTGQKINALAVVRNDYERR